MGQVNLPALRGNNPVDKIHYILHVSACVCKKGCFHKKFCLQGLSLCGFCCLCFVVRLVCLVFFNFHMRSRVL